MDILTNHVLKVNGILIPTRVDMKHPPVAGCQMPKTCFIPYIHTGFWSALNVNGGRDYTSTENDLVMEISGAFEDNPMWRSKFQFHMSFATGEIQDCFDGAFSIALQGTPEV